MKKQENVTYSEKNHSTENPEMTKMIELVNKDIKSYYNCIHMLKKLQEILNMLGGNLGTEGGAGPIPEAVRAKSL